MTGYFPTLPPETTAAEFKAQLPARLGCLVYGLLIGGVLGLMLGATLAYEFNASAGAKARSWRESQAAAAEGRVLEHLTHFVRTHRRWPTGTGDFVVGLAAVDPSRADAAVHDLQLVRVHFALTLADIDPADPGRFRGLIEPSDRVRLPDRDEQLTALMRAIAEAKRAPTEEVKPSGDASPAAAHAP